MKTFDDSKELEDIGSIKQSLIQVKKIHSILEELKVFGFSDKKVTQWMLKFLTKKTKLMKKVFISQYINKKSVNDAYSFEH